MFAIHNGYPRVDVSLGSGDGRFGPSLPVGEPEQIAYVALAEDINRDGKTDIVWAAWSKILVWTAW